ncbi:conserved hypothetical protein [Microsporum canis CBS 113480]|uniref:Uncharacterized protein n=1 Tax=Arthroderma otae (strain ATCC MYA-4605 / CBS 113480) TaxID=554155 RepID=C5FUV1_ARTOC|nr:conserved hypothetical protein [Microsporum canis CBS 113480]EEQ33685.1 conserved hypothetical protein [Microsporum canis CBS 113480]
MGQRHNRRRTRPRSRRRINNNNAASRLQQTVVMLTPLHQPETYPYASLPLPLSCSPGARNHWHDRVPSAQLWHNRYLAWHGRSTSTTSSSSTSTTQGQRREATKLEVEQCRLFGGEPGDDVTLCFRMLEFFSGLDFIE